MIYKIDRALNVYRIVECDKYGAPHHSVLEDGIEIYYRRAGVYGELHKGAVGASDILKCVYVNRNQAVDAVKEIIVNRIARAEKAIGKLKSMSIRVIE